MPQMGTSIAEATLIAWHKQVGDAVALDETICEISTDKIDTEFPAPVSGTVAELLAEAGDTVAVGAVIARISIAGSGNVARTQPHSLDGALEVQQAERVPSVDPACRPARVSPLVARIAEQHGLNLATVRGTGRGGRITKNDALAAVRLQTVSPSPPARDEPPLHSESPYQAEAEVAIVGGVDASSKPPDGARGSLSRIRQSIGAAMLRSQSTTATCHTLVECDMTRVELRRRELGITALSILARSVIETLGEFPDLNATLDGATITRYGSVHLGIAVSLGQDGLIVPVVRNAQNLAPAGLHSAVQDLAKRARAKQLSPDDVRGATFTITNPGAFGALIATPIIDLPQVAILDLEAIVRRPVVATDAHGNESIAIRSMVNLILGWDHRAMDGIYAAQFLGRLRGRLESLG
jgi:pyruvate/2-oxoglutarate dehydrogenase complex dihydrolipoamide acyltransferase (E2) component